jgi:periplasmic protein TonB
MTTYLLVQGRDPQRAALLSLFPGAGQLYNGEIRKAVLFFLSGSLNLAIFFVLLGANSLASNLAVFASSFHFRFDPELGHILRELNFGSAPSFVLIGSMLAFVALAMRDAYDHARFKNDSLLYPAHLLDFPEATSGSYLIHIATLLVCFLLGLFLIVPNKPKEQITEIEFIDVPVQTKVKTESKIKAQNAQEAHGARVTEHPNQPQHAAQRSSAPSHTVPTPPARQTQAQTQEQPPQSAPPQIRPILHTPVQPVAPAPPSIPRPQQRSVSNMPPLPTAPTNVTRESTPVPINPAAALPKNSTPLPSLPAPSSAKSVTGTPSPTLAMAPRQSGFQSQAPSAVPIANSSETGSNPTPVPMARTQSTSHSIGKEAPRPAHALPSGSGIGKELGPIAMIPNLASQNGTNSDSSTNKVGPNGPTGPVVEPLVDFGFYMAQLQRRIKKYWSPTKAQSSLVVKVQFSIQRGGQLSNLHLIKSSGLSEADKQALAAVENAAPFAPLPTGSPESVDIEFTFDYNVFQGGHGFSGKFGF